MFDRILNAPLLSYDFINHCFLKILDDCSFFSRKYLPQNMLMLLLNFGEIGFYRGITKTVMYNIKLNFDVTRSRRGIIKIVIYNIKI